MSIRRPSISFAAAWGVALLPPCLGACTAHSNAASAGPLLVRDAWVRATNATAPGAAYLVVENAESAGVTIVGVGSPMARAAEFHETQDMQGMTHMSRIDSIPLAPRGTLEMKPGGLHIMLIDLAASIALGDTVPVVLHFGDGRTATVKSIARDDLP